MLGAIAFAAVAWSCSVPMLADYTPKVKPPDVGSGVTYVAVNARNMHTNYAADALFQQNLDGRQGWHATSIMLAPLKENFGVVQLEISRWERFSYAQHIAISWSLPHTQNVFYKDLPLMLSDSVPHRLGMAVHNGVLALIVDGATVCTTRSSYFVTDAEQKYFQIRDETAVLGHNGNSSVSDIRLKRDSDPMLRRFTSDCVFHREGLSWTTIDGGQTFVSRGAFSPSAKMYFTGLDPTTEPSCT